MSTSPRPIDGVHVTVVGIGADGWTGLSERLRSLVLGADVVFGAPRQLDLLPPADTGERVAWPSPLRPGLAAALAPYAGRTVVALASGDPLVSGIGATLIEVLGTAAVRIEPTVSSVALARARMGWAAESVEVISVVGRDVHLVLRALAPGHRLLVLSSDASTPAALAALLDEVGYGATILTVLGDLGAATESIVSGTAAGWTSVVPALNVVALEPVGPLLGGWVAGLPDELFEHDGQLTKRDLRASALARLLPHPGALLWDVGAGAGSVGIEWSRAHPTCSAIAIEKDPERAERIGRNAARLGVPGLRVVPGDAPEALADLPQPDAIFIGGGATRDGVLKACLAALRPGGRLVVHGVTLETEALLARAYNEHGGELSRLSVEQAAPVGTFTGWTPARTVTQWAFTAPLDVEPVETR